MSNGDKVGEPLPPDHAILSTMERAQATVGDLLRKGETMAHIDLATGTASTLRPLTGNDATATFEDDPRFAGPNATAYASSDDIEAQYEHDDAEDEGDEDEEEEYEVAEDVDDEEDEEDDEDVDDEDEEEDDDAVAEDDDEDEEAEDDKVAA
jgi:hypothetical protein